MFEFNQVLNAEILSICAKKISNMYILSKETIICVYMNNDEALDTLDKMLWIQSRKLFIPHATNKDPYPLEQQILLTTDKLIHNNAETFLFVNAFDRELLSKSKNSIFIFDNEMQDIKALRSFYLEMKKTEQNMSFNKYS